MEQQHVAPIALDEDGGFGIYGSKTRYTTLQRNRETAPNNLTSAASNNGMTSSTRGYETMRNLRTSIPSLVSQNG